MSNIFFISDLHLGHKNILKFSPDLGGQDEMSHAEWLVSQWNSRVTKQDVTYVLGDVCFNKDYMKYLKEMNGVKHLVLGNHDEFQIEVYKEYFHKIYGLKKKYGVWLSHAPIHPGHLRGSMNIHGHLHSNVVRHTASLGYASYTLPPRDSRYLNVSVEQLNGAPISLDDVRLKLNSPENT